MGNNSSAQEKTASLYNKKFSLTATRLRERDLRRFHEDIYQTDAIRRIRQRRRLEETSFEGLTDSQQRDNVEATARTLDPNNGQRTRLGTGQAVSTTRTTSEANAGHSGLEDELANILRVRRERIECNEEEIGQGAVSTTTHTDSGEKCYDPNDRTMEFVDGDDDMDFLLDGYKSLRAKMSCGHTVTPMSLTNWIRKSLDEGNTKFVCGVCGVIWEYDEIQKMALLTPEEIKYFEKAMYKITESEIGAKKCPGCKSAVVRRDLNNLRVVCIECTGRKSRPYEFCWQCLKEWKRPSPHSDRCADPDCVNNQQEVLRTCPDIIFKNKDLKNIKGCPSVRACPTCGMIIAHNREQCKKLVCPRCKSKFCFVCLRLTSVCDSYWVKCSIDVAPRQTSIPVWQKKVSLPNVHFRDPF